MSLLLLGGDWSDGEGGDPGAGVTGRLKSPYGVVLACVANSEPYTALKAQGWTDTSDAATQGGTLPQAA